MKACKSKLAEAMLRAKVPVYRHAKAEKPFQFEGRWYLAKFIPTRPST